MEEGAWYVTTIQKPDKRMLGITSVNIHAIAYIPHRPYMFNVWEVFICSFTDSQKITTQVLVEISLAHICNHLWQLVRLRPKTNNFNITKPLTNPLLIQLHQDGRWQQVLNKWLLSHLVRSLKCTLLGRSCSKSALPSVEYLASCEVPWISLNLINSPEIILFYLREIKNNR